MNILNQYFENGADNSCLSSYRLLKLEIVKRSGQGGRIDPYMYTVIIYLVQYFQISLGLLKEKENLT